MYVKPIAASTYTIEIAVNWFAGLSVYLNDWFCLVDIASTTPFIIAQYLEASWIHFEWLIMFRIFRFLFRYVGKTDYTIKVTNQVPNFIQSQIIALKLVVDTISKSIQEIIYTMGLLVILFLLFSVAIIELTGKYCDHFATVGKCIWSFFTAVTMDGWVDIVDDLQRQVYPPDIPDFFDKTDREFAYSFGIVIMIGLIIIGGFVFNNLFVAIVVAKLDISLQQEKKLDSVIDSAQSMFIKKDDTNEEEMTLAAAAAAAKINSGGKGHDAANAAAKAAAETANAANAHGNDTAAIVIGADGNPENPADLDDLNLDEYDDDDPFDEPNEDIVPILPYKDVKKIYEPLAQLNINNEEITKVSIGRVEDFFTMVYALENNLVEYRGVLGGCANFSTSKNGKIIENIDFAVLGRYDLMDSHIYPGPPCITG